MRGRSRLLLGRRRAFRGPCGAAPRVRDGRALLPADVRRRAGARPLRRNFARAFWGADAVPTDALRRIFRAAYAQQITACAPLAVVEPGAVVAVANYVSAQRLGIAEPGRPSLRMVDTAGLLARPRHVRCRLGWYSRAAFRLLPYQPRCMVMQLAVAPSAQGHGHARALLNAVRERSRADLLSTGVAITTYSEALNGAEWRITVSILIAPMPVGARCVATHLRLDYSVVKRVVPPVSAPRPPCVRPDPAGQA